MKPPKILSCERVVERDTAGVEKPPNRWLNTYNITYEMPNGKKGVYTFVSRKTPKLDGTISPDAVVIAAFVGEKLVVTSEFRFPFNGYEYGLVAGLIDPGETIETAIRRELKEETGLDLTQVLSVGPPITVSPGMTDEAICVAIVSAEGQISKDGLQDIEDISTQLMDHDQLSQLFARTGEYKGAIISSKLWLLLSGVPITMIGPQLRL